MLPGRRTDNGSIFVIQGTPPVGTPLVGGIAVSPLGAIYINGGSAAWSPIDLFQQNEQGAWYDPSDLSTMFQDSAGTTPVTADGQPVGLIRDKSGNNNHASQATSTARPLYKTDGTYHWLQFDGVDDSLSTAAINFTNTNKVSVFAGTMKGNNATISRLINCGDGAEGSFGIYIPGQASFNEVESSSFITSNGYARWTVSASAVKMVLSNLFNNAETSYPLRYRLRNNSSELTPIAGYTAGGMGSFINSALIIGSTQPIGGTFFINGNIYSLIVLGRLATTQEVTDTEAWVNSKTGAY